MSRGRAHIPVSCDFLAFVDTRHRSVVGWETDDESIHSKIRLSLKNVSLVDGDDDGAQEEV